MKRRLSVLFGTSLLALFAACHTTDTRYNHWRLEGLTPRVAYHLLSYDTNSGIPYRRHASQQRSDIDMTLRRHLLNDNPLNPSQRKNAWQPPQKVFSPLPDPIHFFHLSSVAFAGAMVGAGGSFFLFPIEVIPVLFEEGGPEEMWGGISATFRGERYEKLPPTPEDFEVENP